MANLNFTATKIGQDIGCFMLVDMATNPSDFISNNIFEAKRWIDEYLGYTPRVWYFVSPGRGIYEVSYTNCRKVGEMDVEYRISIKPVDWETVEMVKAR